jgi:hypothetical protein
MTSINFLGLIKIFQDLGLGNYLGTEIISQKKKKYFISPLPNYSPSPNIFHRAQSAKMTSFLGLFVLTQKIPFSFFCIHACMQ